MRNLWLGCLSASLLTLAVACGDTGFAGRLTTAAQGFYAGTLGDGQVLRALVIDDGRFYLFRAGGGGNEAVTSLLYGVGSSDAARFETAEARDFSFEGLGVRPAALSATYAAKRSVTGEIVRAEGAVGFSGDYDPAYDIVPVLRDLAGTFSGRLVSTAGSGEAILTIGIEGDLSATRADACTATGTVRPHTNGNVYDVELRFGGAPCGFSSQPFAGHAYLDSMSGRLLLAAPGSDLADAVVFEGLRP